MPENISLNGEWLFITDEETRLSYESALQKLNSSETKKMKVPSNWEQQGLHNFSGSVWFKTIFELNRKPEQEEINTLKFSGVDYFAEVWLNGTRLGSHEGYFQTFVFDVTHALNYSGGNELIVKVTSPLEEPGTVWPYKKKLIKGIFNHHDCRPGGWSLERGQEQNTGGIWNDVELILGKKIYADSLKVFTSLCDNYEKCGVVVTLSYRNNLKSAVKTKLNYEIKEPSESIIKGEAEAEFKSGSGEITFSMNLKNPALWYSWDVGTPNLYEIKILSDLLDEIHEVFGIKEVKLDNESAFYINGKKLFLRGTNIISAQFLSGLDSGKIKELALLLKEANVNIVRVHAHINRKELYDEFDRQGILVWQDFALQWTYDDSPKFRANAVGQIKDMVCQLYNHPSIAFWCCHNEPGEQINTLDPFLKEAVLNEDGSRIIRLASNYEEHPYDGWYWGNHEHFAAAPMGPLVTEFGAQGIPREESLLNFLGKDNLIKPNWSDWEFHGFQYNQTVNIAKIPFGENITEFTDNSQRYQAELIKNAVNFYRRKKNNGITGIFQFMFIDCWPSITWSVIDFYKKKKLGFYALKEAYQPVYISIGMRQKTSIPNAKLNIECWIINDLFTSSYNSQFIVKLGSNEIERRKIDLPENSIIHIPETSFQYVIPEGMKDGICDLTFELINEHGSVIAESNEKLEIASKEIPWQEK